MPDMIDVWIVPLIFSGANVVLTYVLKKQLDKVEKRKIDEESKKLKEAQQLAEWQKAKDDYQVTIARGLKALLHSEIYQESQRLLKKGWATGDEKRAMEYLYEPYKALGGNGTAASLYHEVLELTTLVPTKIITDDERNRL